MSETATSPSTVHMTTSDVLPFTLDASPTLASGETVTGISTTCTNLVTKTAVTLSDKPTYTTTSATQTVRGSELAAGYQYRLVWVLTLSSGAVLGQATVLSVDY